ncbi:MAG: potassium-transporting ATPase subunit C [Methylocella sp.]
MADFSHYQANGNLLQRAGKIIGSEMIGKNFTIGAIFTGGRR